MSELRKVMEFRKTMRIPDVGERTTNDPSYLMSSNDVLKLIKSSFPEGVDITNGTAIAGHDDINLLDYETSGKEAINEHMVKAIVKEAINHHGWSEVKLIGKQLLFIK